MGPASLGGNSVPKFQVNVQRSRNHGFKAAPFMVAISAENGMLTSDNANASNVKIDVGDFLKHPPAHEIRAIDPRKILHMAPEMLEIENYIPVTDPDRAQLST
ncbi:hypothetical protein RvY_00160 [Ramazzottius varieornatus]|uniref:Uncharacterized protein n=1 Tax=Ramazzottius varieornatus TaxID=947166 RepID=A0A1D1UCR4_RAMVA|nr:hypothetical protein RvY_00160 [Ramazzottius varieornatus]